MATDQRTTASQVGSGQSNRQTTILVVELESGEFCIIASLGTRKDTQVIGIDPSTGALRYTGVTGVDVFGSEWEALQAVTAGAKVKNSLQGRAIIGYLVVGAYSLLLVATKVRASIDGLPGGPVYTITDSQWVRINLRLPRAWPRQNKAAESLVSIPIDDLHYYSETADITHPFPSEYSIDEPEAEFVWNQWLSLPFTAVGLQRHCVVLLQARAFYGIADSRSLVDTSGRKWAVALIARRSRLHPGTRYLARGLNAAASTGNEAECEQLVWMQQPVQGSVPAVHLWSSYLWRRGTVPIWWGAEIKSTVGEAEIYIGDEPFEGCADYYKRLILRYSGESRRKPVETSTGSSRSITCINLLRCAQGRSEMILSENFAESVQQVRATGQLLNWSLQLQNFDWHANVKLVGEVKTVEGLWALLRNAFFDTDLTAGSFSSESLDDPVVGIPAEACQISKRQHGVVRYNCADSLDRTNAASFFGAVQVLAEQCRRLGISVDTSAAATAVLLSPQGRAILTPSAVTSREPPLPANWEARVDPMTGRSFYIDHRTRSTTWVHPGLPNDIDGAAGLEVTAAAAIVDLASSAGSATNVVGQSSSRGPWHLLERPQFEEVKVGILPSALGALAEMFQTAGDIHATLYTGSRAMHSSVIHLFSDQAQKHRRGAAATNMAISLQRRYLNMVVDSSRQAQLETFLGLRRSVHLPGVPAVPMQVLSRPPAFLLQPLPSISMALTASAMLLSTSARNTCWICPAGVQAVDLVISLLEPCRVRQLVLTVAHGLVDTSSPSSFDVQVGRTLDSLHYAAKQVPLPRAAHGTQLLYNIRSSVADGEQDPESLTILYDFDEKDEDISYFSRIVQITFYAGGQRHLTIGQVEVLGETLVRGDHASQARDALVNIEAKIRSIHRADAAQANGDGVHQAKSTVARSAGSLSPKETPVRPFEHLHKADSAPNLFHNTQLGSSTGSGTQGQATASVSGNDLASLLDFATLSPSDAKGSELPSSGDARQPALAAWGLTNGSQKSASAEPQEQQRSAEYLRLVRSTCSNQHLQQLKLVDVLELELSRWNLGLSALLRNHMLRSAGFDPSIFDPNSHLGPENALQLRRLAQASDNASVSRDKVGSPHRNDAADTQGGVLAAARLLRQVLKVAAARRKDRAWAAASQALADMKLLGCGTANLTCRDLSAAPRLPGLSFAKEESSLAVFPLAGFLRDVPTASTSATADVLLCTGGVRQSSSTYQQNWQAPPGVSEVELVIALSWPAVLTRIVIGVDLLGYSDSDVPLVDVWVGNSIADRMFQGRWDIGAWESASQNSASSAPVHIASGRHLAYSLPSAVQCRVVWLRLSLPKVAVTAVSASPAAPPGDASLMSLWELSAGMGGAVPMATSQSGTAATATRSSSTLHMGRLYILGERILHRELLSNGSERLTPAERAKLQSLLEEQPTEARAKVNVVSEEVRLGGRVVEITIAALTSYVSGFRLDMDLQKNPSSSKEDGAGLAAEATGHEKEAGASAYIRVTSMQAESDVGDSYKRGITLGGFAVPAVKENIGLCFDFQKPETGRVFIFELVGGRDGVEGAEDAEDMSLAGKLRLYQYVPKVVK
eukprot:jgi/Chlat1/2580/Chrsp178S02444